MTFGVSTTVKSVNCHCRFTNNCPMCFTHHRTDWNETSVKSPQPTASTKSRVLISIASIVSSGNAASVPTGPQVHLSAIGCRIDRPFRRVRATIVYTQMKVAGGLESICCFFKACSVPTTTFRMFICATISGNLKWKLAARSARRRKRRENWAIKVKVNEFDVCFLWQTRHNGGRRKLRNS